MGVFLKRKRYLVLMNELLFRLEKNINDRVCQVCTELINELDICIRRISDITINTSEGLEKFVRHEINLVKENLFNGNGSYGSPNFRPNEIEYSGLIAVEPTVVVNELD